MTTALQTQPRPGSLVPSDLQWGMTRDQLDLLKRTIARGTSDDEFALFMTVAQRRGLDPFDRQIHAVMRYDTDLERKVMSIQVGIDGYRLGATRTGEENGQDGPYWCGDDGVWKDVWLSEDDPAAAKVIVYRKGRERGYVGIALWGSYVQLKKDGTATAMWRRHGPGQLAKCAEALAIRKAFPQELGGTHTDDELGAADAIDVEFRTIETATPVVQPRPPVEYRPTVPVAPPAAAARQEPPAAPTPPPPVPSHHADRQAAEDAARETALAKARENAAELDQARRAAAAPPAPEQATKRDTAPAAPAKKRDVPPGGVPGTEIQDDEFAELVADLYVQPHLGALKTLALGISRRKATKDQRIALDAAFITAEKKLKAAAAGPAANGAHA